MDAPKKTFTARLTTTRLFVRSSSMSTLYYSGLFHVNICQKELIKQTDCSVECVCERKR